MSQDLQNVAMHLKDIQSVYLFPKAFFLNINGGDSSWSKVGEKRIKLPKDLYEYLNDALEVINTYLSKY